MSTNQEIPEEIKAAGAHRPGPNDPSVEADLSDALGTKLIVALIAIIIIIFFAALYANGLYRSELQKVVETQGAASTSGAATKARAASADRATQGGSVEDEDGNVVHSVPVNEGGNLLLQDPSSLSGTPEQQVATGGNVADIPALPSYDAVLDPEAAAAAAAEEAEAAKQDAAEDASTDEAGDDAPAEDNDGDNADAEDADAEEASGDDAEASDADAADAEDAEADTAQAEDSEKSGDDADAP